MLRTFSQTPEVCTRTMQFIDRCNLKMAKVDNPFPDFIVPEGETLDSYFEQVCREGPEDAPRNRHRPSSRPRHPQEKPSPNITNASTAN